MATAISIEAPVSASVAPLRLVSPETHEVRCGERRRGGLHHGERCLTIIGYSPVALDFVGVISRAPADARTIITFRCWRCKAWNLYSLHAQD